MCAMLEKIYNKHQIQHLQECVLQKTIDMYLKHALVPIYQNIRKYFNFMGNSVIQLLKYTNMKIIYFSNTSNENI